MSRAKLKRKIIKGLEGYQKRVLFFDPSVIYKRVKVNKYKRLQSICMSKMFPKIKGKCACGCGKKLEGRRTKWCSDECSAFAYNVSAIINGDSAVITKWLKLYLGNWACCQCGLTDSYKEFKNGLSVSTIHKDHILAVMNGGGGCWLSNYQLLCEDCHKEKTKEDLKVIKKKR